MTVLQNLHYTIKGPNQTDSVPLVFLHGLMGFYNNWLKITKAFEEKHQILLYDQRGHGKSFQPETGYTADNYVGDLKDLLVALKLKKVQLIGHSMGGRVAMVFASQYPEMVEILVIEDIGPQMQDTSKSVIFKILQNVPVPFSTNEAAQTYFQSEFPRLFPNAKNLTALSQFLRANIVQGESGEFNWKFYKKGMIETLELARGRDWWKEWDSLRIPTLLVRGEYSTDLTQEMYDEMLKRQSNAHGVVIKGAGHWVHSEKSGEFISALMSFLTS